MENVVKKILDKCLDVEFTRYNIMVGYLQDGFIFEVINMILAITRWIIWKRRCVFKYDGRYVDINELERWIHQDVTEHIEVLLLIENVKNKEILNSVKCKLI